MRRLFFIVFLLIAGGVTFVSRESLLRTPTFEEGDDAANALQIERAKHFREIHGNYSRWSFHHPGPAFFYAEAAGELLLHKVTHLAASPHSAHVYASTLLQLAFYAAALALVARKARQPWLVVAFGLGAAAVHFPFIDRGFYSIWPPDVLVMPFLCFLVACAVVAAGDVTALPILAVAGSFLVHGHIAQPLFVIPLTLLSLTLLAVRSRGRLKATLLHRRVAIASALVFLFVLPLLLDLLDGRHSNAHDVLLHFRFQTDKGQTAWQGLLCYLSYYVGLSDPSVFNQLTAESYQVFRDHRWLMIGWSAGLAALLAALYWPANRQKKKNEARTLGRMLLLFWLGAGALTVVWGMRQDGGFTNFNSQFNHAIVHALLLGGALAFAEAVPTFSRGVHWTAVGAAAVAFVVSVPYQLAPGSRGDEAEARVNAILQADPHPAAPKLLQFGPDNWYESVTLARALQRRGIPFYVSSGWRIMFGSDKVFANQGGVLGNGGISVWRVNDRGDTGNGAHVLNRYATVRFRAVPQASVPVRLTFAPGATSPLPLCGVGPAEGDWAWTDGHVAALEFAAENTTRDLQLTIDAGAIVTPLNPRGQRGIVSVNGTIVGNAVFTDTRMSVSLCVPQAAWNRAATKRIVIDLPDALAPADTGTSGDRRVLGLRLYAIEVR